MIVRSNMDGSNATLLVNSDLSYPGIPYHVHVQILSISYVHANKLNTASILRNQVIITHLIASTATDSSQG